MNRTILVCTPRGSMRLGSEDFKRYLDERRAGKLYVPKTGTVLPVRSVTQEQLAKVAELKRRFEICNACPSTTNAGFGCKHHTGCCFGRWRSDLNNHCAEGKW